MKFFEKSAIFPSLALAVLAFFSYGKIIHFYFTDVDTFSLINHGRFSNIRELFNILSSELMAGRMINAIYYRPMTSITFGIEHALFGLDAKGYHQVDLALFFLTSCFIVLICKSLWGKKRGTWIGLIAGICFLLHPLQVDNVPAIARLGDLLATFFATLSLALFLIYFFSKEKNVFTTLFFIGSVIFSFLGLCSKEPAVVAPGTIFLLVLFFSKEKTIWKRFIEGFKILLPYAVCTAIFVITRSLILRGLGGYVSSKGLFDDPDLMSIGFRFQTTFVGHLLGLFLPSLSDHWDRLGLFLMDIPWILILLAGVIGLIYYLKLHQKIKAALCIPYNPAESQKLIDQRIVWVFIGAILIHSFLLFFTIFTARYLYFSTVFFSILLGFFLFFIFEKRKNSKKYYLSCFVTILFLAPIFYNSPLWCKKRLNRWDTGGKIAEQTLSDLKEIVKKNPKRNIYLFNIPYVLTYGSNSPTFWELPFNQILLEHAIDDYLDLARIVDKELPHSGIRVLNYLFLTHDPDQFKTDIRFLSKKDINVYVSQGGLPCPFPWSRIPGRGIHEDYFYLKGGKENFKDEPLEGWPKNILVSLTDKALSKPKPRFYTFDGKGLKKIAYTTHWQ